MKMKLRLLIAWLVSPFIMFALIVFSFTAAIAEIVGESGTQNWD